MQDTVDMSNLFSSTKSKPMVMVQNAYKSYGNNAVLKGLCMTIPQGTIYGLLGPSGCGKTTLLCCITRQIELDQGSVELNIKRRTQLGYMPQFISLFDGLSVMENFMFYGYVIGMSKNEIEVQSRDLISFLEIPSGNRIVRHMSGGQQRRVSMAVAFLHDPTLLILDEPTVGLDPILCQSIWNKMSELASKGKSIVITTHYIQEAQRAGRVGLMRNGRLLVEDNPQTLMTNFECANLEDVFYRVITEQERNPSQSNQSNNGINRVHNYRSVNVHYEDDNKIVSKKRIKGLVFKSINKLRRDIFLFWIIVSFPLLQCTLYNLTVGRKPDNLNIAILNEEIPFGDCHLHYSDRICLFDEGEKYLSCHFIYQLQKNYKVLEYNNVTDAMHDLHNDKVSGVLLLPANYTVSLTELFTHGIMANDSDSIIRGFPNVWIDNSNFLVFNFLKYDIIQALLIFLRQTAENCGLNPDAILIAIKIEPPVIGDIEGKHSSYIAVAMMVIASFSFPAFATALMFIEEKLGGQIERMLVAGVTFFEILVAQLCIQLMISVVQILLMIFVNHVIFDNPLKGSGLTLFWLMLITSMAGIFSGFIMTLITNNMTATASLGISVSICLSLTCGLFGPREGMDDVLKYAGSFLPITWSIEAARGIADKNAPFTDKHVLKGFYATAIWNLVFSLFLFYYARYKKNSFISKP